jgi:DNA primase
MSSNIIEIGNDILKQVDIVDIISSFIKVSKKGRNYLALCPFHNDTNPSLSISREKQIFKCFTCGTSGNAITFVKKYKNCSYFDAVKIVAQIAGIRDERLENVVTHSNISEDTKKTYSCLTEINKYYEGFLFQTEEGQNSALKYLHDRGLTDDVINRFKLGYSLKNGELITNRLLNEGFSLKTIEKTGIGLIYDEKIKDNNAGRVIFSISNSDGQIVGFSARQLITDKSQGKYINSPESEGGVFHKSDILYNYFNAKDDARRLKFVYVVEGFMDAIALDRIGIHNVVALMGTALTTEHIRLLRFLNCEIRLCLDNDGPGQDAMIKVASQLDKNDLKFVFVSNAQVSSGKDSDEILKKSGPEGLKTYLTNLISEGEFILNYYSTKLDMNNLDNKKMVLQRFIPFLSQIKNPLDLEVYSKKLSQITGFSLEIIYSQTSAYKARKTEVNYDSPEPIVHFKKKNPTLNKLELSERQIVRYMLDNKDAVKQYNLKLGYLVNDNYREIANLIEQYAELNIDENYSASSIINYVNGYSEDIDDKAKEKVINEITSISLDDYKIPPYSVETFDDCVHIINEKKEWQRSNEAYSQGSIGKTNDEKVQQAIALLEKRKELISQKEKGENVYDKKGN